MQGDRVSGATKPATLETGLTIQALIFEGEAVVSIPEQKLHYRA